MRSANQVEETASALELSRRQRSHVLCVLSEPRAGREQSFLEWYLGSLVLEMRTTAGVLSAQHYERHEVDITRGRYPPLPFRYLGLYGLSLDGAEAASSVIDRVTALHEEQATAGPPATWLYYPASERVGRAPGVSPSMLTIAFANGLPGQEAEFREWYATRHIRHALNVPALVSGQVFERTLFQKPGALDAKFSAIAVYEQEGSPESIVESLQSLPKGTFHFPSIDPSRFTECTYRPL